MADPQEVVHRRRTTGGHQRDSFGGSHCLIIKNLIKDASPVDKGGSDVMRSTPFAISVNAWI